MTVYPYLPQAHVAMTSAKTYLGLLTGLPACRGKLLVDPGPSECQRR
jgi:hypothetical protein